VVEHDEETMREADILVDIGPKAGKHGGKIVSIGTPEEIMKDPNSPTGRFLSKKESIPVPKKRRKVNMGSNTSIDYELEVKKIKAKWLNEILEFCNI
jgi:excinuclease UvrABC ATPase subunit